MGSTITDNIKLARQILAGKGGLTVTELSSLAHDLTEENNIGYARRIYSLALAQAPTGQRDDLRMKLAFATSKDGHLPVEERLKTAEGLLLEVLARAANLSPEQHQEALGLLGGVYKARWSVYGHKDHLEKAIFYYRLGYQMGIASDLGYTALNAAFVLDLLADAERGISTEASTASQTRTAEADKMRSEIVSVLSEMSVSNSSLEARWWFDSTLGEAYLGLRQFDEARTWVQRAAAHESDNWRLESTARQIAHIVRLQSRADGLPMERWNEAPGFAVLSDLLGGSAAAAMSFFLGKVGLALSGGGFRASLYHIGVLARLAELDMLRHVEVISSVSGGSILGAYYYLELRHLLQTKLDTAITRQDYVDLVKRVESGFLAGVQRNIRLRMMLEPGSNWKVLTSRSTTTARLADLYERELYSRVNDEFQNSPQRYIQDLVVAPAGTQPGDTFSPRYDNWKRCHKVPILILNATALNTCHNWQFTATYMGEPPIRTIDTKIDGNDRLRRMYYDQAPPQYRRVRLGQAVAASACVPGLFDPLMLEPLYPDYTAKLVDGGVYDNQGVASLLGEDCTVLLVSDASGQTAVEKEPGGERIGVSLRANNVLMARSRQEGYQLLSALNDAGLLRGLAYVHLKKDLDARSIDWLGCSDPTAPEPKNILTTYGVRKDVQAALAAIRTDLDAFSNTEADALMLSGYRMMQEEFQTCISGFPVEAAAPVDWSFLSVDRLAGGVEESPELSEFRRALDVARNTTFKPYRVSAGVKLISWLAAAVGLVGLVLLVLASRGHTVSIARLLAVIAVFSFAAMAAKEFLKRVLRNPNPLWQILLALPLLVLGWPLLWLFTTFLDPVYLHSGPRYRKDLATKS
ncbi:MAG TPA: patatin-like phospholipase family protein [Candidatus Sulfopaludibacter sp.]|jgi:predicted acylesterase/phospholipase RssA|nr:patatin-like phospholipase family protein [Candidatus Sulfopaludibacter sp.]